MPADRSTVFFDKISGAYDREFSEGFSGSEQRKSIHRYLTKYVLQKKLISAHPSILELNGGTGTDALFLHSLGCHVSYSDGSREMVTVAAQKFSNHNVFIDASVINLNNPSEHQKKYSFSGLPYNKKISEAHLNQDNLASLHRTFQNTLNITNLRSNQINFSQGGGGR